MFRFLSAPLLSGYPDDQARSLQGLHAPIMPEVQDVKVLDY